MAKKKKQEIKKIEEIDEVEDVEEIDEVEEIDDDEEEEEIEVSNTKKKNTTYKFEDDADDLSLEDRIVNVENKINILLFMVLVCVIMGVILLVNAFSSGDNKDRDYSNTDTATEEYTTTYSYDTSAFKEITADQIQSESKKETIVVLIGRQGCYYCAEFAPIITSVAKDFKVTIRYIDLAKIVNFNVAQPYISDETSWKTLTSLTGSGEWKTFADDNMGGTPLTLIIKNNKVVGGIAGAYEAGAVENAFTSAGLRK